MVYSNTQDPDTVIYQPTSTGNKHKIGRGGRGGEGWCWVLSVVICWWCDVMVSGRPSSPQEVREPTQSQAGVPWPEARGVGV